MTQQTDDRERIEVKPGKVREMKPGELGLRFAFGAGVSLLAGIVSTVWGPAAGGVFLAFPAILLASLTIVAKKDGAERAADDSRGASLGAIGLLAFALVAWKTLPRWPDVWALAAATVAWLAASLAAYAVLRALGGGGDRG